MRLVYITIRLFCGPNTPRWRETVLLGCVCFLLAFPAPLRSQQPPGWQWQNPLPQGNIINSIRFASDKKYGWAVGSDGAILRTRNGGFEWETQTSPASTTL